MKKAFSILMITAMMLPSLTKIGILIDFKINQDYIATFLCINREEPMSMCSGKCYLSKQLKKAEAQEEQQAPTGKKESVEFVYCCDTSPDFLFFVGHYISKRKPVYEDGFFTSSFIVDVFRPPKLNLI